VRVLVTGATGLVGSAVARELVARGHGVRVLARATSDVAGVEQIAAEVARGDVLDRASVARAIRGCDAVIHAAGVVGFHPGMRERLLAVNAGGAEVVLGAALDARVERAVLTSSVGVVGGTREPRVADEETPSNAEALGITYLVSKLRGEEAALALAARGLPVVVVRPGYVIGPGGRHGTSAATLLAVARRRVPAYVEGGTSYADVRDVARGHVEALERGRAGEVYVLGGHNLATSEMLRRVAEMAGVPPPRRLPYAAGLALAAAGALAARATGKRARLTVDLVRSSALYTFVTSAKAQRELGYAIRPFEESARDTLRWYVAEGKLEAATPELRAIAAG
jgi:dihydroflavonol-4-reductase